MSDVFTAARYSGNVKYQKPNTGFAPPAAASAPYVGHRNFYGSGKYKYFIYPDDSWDVKKWGKKPFLGAVYADEPFYAVREAYGKGIVPMNVTFGLIALKEKLDEEQFPARRYNKQ